eukprot:gene10023-biopygen12695
MMEEYEERDLVSEDEYDEAVEEMNRVLGKRNALPSRPGMVGLGRLGLHPPKKVAKINGSEDEPTDDYAADSDKEITLPKGHQRKKFWPGPERKKKRVAASATLGEYRALYEQGESSTSIKGPSNAEDVATLGEISLDFHLQEELEVTQTEGLINSFTLDESSQNVGSEQLLANLQI